MEEPHPAPCLSPGMLSPPCCPQLHQHLMQVARHGRVFSDGHVVLSSLLSSFPWPTSPHLIHLVVGGLASISSESSSLGRGPAHKGHLPKATVSWHSPKIP